ncbi:hypothetical protein, partial [Bordetella pertussis]|uniref:hypothetical protein n=1 Tax=Bordetella pertussis TaxID=520 RepID=UPI001C9E73E3
HLQTQPGRIQPIDSSQLGQEPRMAARRFAAQELVQAGGGRCPERKVAVRSETHATYVEF